MKIVFAAILSVPLMTGLVGQASAAASAQMIGGSATSATYHVAANEYDFPAFGSQQWWEQEGDRG